MVNNMDIASYLMFWQVDSDRLNQMDTASQDYPHKEAWVDVSSWTWKGSSPYGPYALTFVVKNSAGQVLGQRTVNIRAY